MPGAQIDGILQLRKKRVDVKHTNQLSPGSPPGWQTYAKESVESTDFVTLCLWATPSTNLLAHKNSWGAGDPHPKNTLSNIAAESETQLNTLNSKP